MSTEIHNITLTPRPIRQHPLRQSTLPPTTSPSLSDHDYRTSRTGSPGIDTTPRADMYRPRLAPILTDISPLTHIEYEEDALTAIPRPAVVSISPLSPLSLITEYTCGSETSPGISAAYPASTTPKAQRRAGGNAEREAITMSPVSPTGMPTPASPPLNSNPYISPSNPISRFALPTFSPRAYSTIMEYTSPRCSHPAKRSPVLTSPWPRVQNPDMKTSAHMSPHGDGTSSSRISKAQRGMQNAMRQRNGPFASPAVLHLGSQAESSVSGPPRLASSPLLNDFDANVHASMLPSTYPVELPFPLAPSPTLISTPHSGARSGRFSILRLILPMQTTAFIRAHLSLLLYVALGMLISLTLLSNDPAVRMGLGRGLGFNCGAGQVVDLAVPTVPVHYISYGRGGLAGRDNAGKRPASGLKATGKSNMGVWADYADTLRRMEGNDLRRAHPPS